MSKKHIGCDFQGAGILLGTSKPLLTSNAIRRLASNRTLSFRRHLWQVDGNTGG